MYTLKKTMKAVDLAKETSLIDSLKGNEILQLFSENSAGDHSLKIVMTQEMFLEMQNKIEKKSINNPFDNDLSEKIKFAENLYKKAVKIVDVFQEEFKNKKQL